MGKSDQPVMQESAGYTPRCFKSLNHILLPSVVPAGFRCTRLPSLAWYPTCDPLSAPLSFPFSSLRVSFHIVRCSILRSRSILVCRSPSVASMRYTSWVLVHSYVSFGHVSYSYPGLYPRGHCGTVVSWESPRVLAGMVVHMKLDVEWRGGCGASEARDKVVVVKEKYRRET